MGPGWVVGGSDICTDTRVCACSRSVTWGLVWSDVEKHLWTPLWRMWTYPYQCSYWYNSTCTDTHTHSHTPRTHMHKYTHILYVRTYTWLHIYGRMVMDPSYLHAFIIVITPSVKTTYSCTHVQLQHLIHSRVCMCVCISVCMFFPAFLCLWVYDCASLRSLKQ